MSSRENILNRIKESLKSPSEMVSSNVDVSSEIQAWIASITPKDKNALWAQFQKELKSIAGEFHSVGNLDEAALIIKEYLSESKCERLAISKENVCSEAAEIVKNAIPNVMIVSPDNLSFEKRKKEFAVTEVAVVNPFLAVADIGSLVFPYDQTGTSYPHFLCDNTFAIIHEEQIVANQFELFEIIDKDKAKNMVFVTGPSRTADIEKVLVLGAHGPRKLVVIMYSEKSGK